MLKLARRVGESLLIGDDIELRILAVQGNQVRLAIQAPPDVRIVRPEAKNKLPRRQG